MNDRADYCQECGHLWIHHGKPLPPELGGGVGCVHAVIDRDGVCGCPKVKDQ